MQTNVNKQFIAKENKPKISKERKKLSQLATTIFNTNSQSKKKKKLFLPKKDNDTTMFYP